MTHLFLAVSLFLLQTDADGATAPATNNGSAILEMLQNSGPIAIGVLAILAIASVWSWAIILASGQFSPRRHTEQALPARFP